MTLWMSLRSPCRIPLVRMIFVLLALGPVLLVSCGQETIPPPHPEPNPNPEQCQQWPAHYYCLVETGVSSRVLGIRAPRESLADARSKVAQLLGKVEEQWDNIAPLETAQEIITYFRAQNLNPLAEAIEKTLVSNRTQEPTGGARHSQLQAMAIKAGLIYAYTQVNGRWPR